MSTVGQINGDKLAGLVVGEGCFYVESAPDPKYRLGWRIRPGFCVEMRAEELEVLTALQSALGCGHIYELDFGRYEGYEDRGWVPHAKFRVTRLSDLSKRVVPFFESHELFGRKALAFKFFRSIVAAITAGEHRSPEGLERVRKLAADLKQHNARGKPSVGKSV